MGDRRHSTVAFAVAAVRTFVGAKGGSITFLRGQAGLPGLDQRRLLHLVPEDLAQFCQRDGANRSGPAGVPTVPVQSAIDENYTLAGRRVTGDLNEGRDLLFVGFVEFSG